MSDSPDPRIVRDFARRAILSAAEEVDYIGIGEQFGDDESWPAEQAAYDAMHDAVDAEWKKATVTVSWPDEQPQDGGDVRAVAVLAAADNYNKLHWAVSNLIALFADRIEALEARDAKVGGSNG